MEHTELRWKIFTDKERRAMLTAMGYYLAHHYTKDDIDGVATIVDSLFDAIPDPDTYDVPEIGKYDVYVR